MRSWKFVGPVLLIVLFASSALAAGSSMSSSSSSTSSGSWTLGINGGGSFPTGDYKDVANTGWNIGGQGDYWINSMWGVGVDAAYHANNGSDDFNAALVADPAFGTGSEVKWSTIQYGAHVAFMIPTQSSQIFPYLQGGVAGYNVKFKIDGGLQPGDESVNKVGFNIGTGVDFRATPVVNLGINGTYNYVPKDTEFNDKALNWFGVQGRVNFKIPTSSK